MASAAPRSASSGGSQRAIDRRHVLLGALATGAVLVLLYVALPAIAGLDETWRRLRSGQAGWLVAALAFECLSFACYMAYFRTAFAGTAAGGWTMTYRITMAGVVATRLLAVAGAGGIALTAWALRRAGLGRREVATRMAAFYLLLYGLYMAALVLFGFGLHWGAFQGSAPGWLTFVPAVFGLVAIAATLLIALVSDDLDRVLRRYRGRSGRLLSARRATAAVPAAIASGTERAIALLRTRRIGLLGAPGWWVFDIAVLWACLEAFGAAPPPAVIVMAYFVGMLANTLPVPGGVGAVDGGMIAALIGFGLPPGYAIVSVLSYRALAFWLPIVPGVLAYAQLLRGPNAREPQAPTGGGEPAAAVGAR